jgi:dienelactone hydrolase
MLEALLIVATLTALPAAQVTPDPAHQTLYYKSGTLNIEAYFYKPDGAGPFPLVVYNHGSRPGEERVEWPVAFIARLLVPEGYAVIVPERRGYGKSDGKPFSEEIGSDRGPAFVARLRAEADDANAAVEYAKANLPVDARRIVMMGYSFGGMVTTLSAAGSTSLRAAVAQAPGALTWTRSPDARRALVEGAGRIRIPMLCMVARNDATTESATAICGAAKAHGSSARAIVYPPFNDPRARNAAAPGHALFTFMGVDVWKKDLLDFLSSQLALKPKD